MSDRELSTLEATLVRHLKLALEEIDRLREQISDVEEATECPT